MMLNSIRLKSTSGKSVFALTILTAALYLTMVFVTLPELSQRADGMAVFDLMPAGYGVDHAAGLLGALGADGRNFYLTRQIPLDLLYPGLLALWMMMLWSLLVRKLGLSGGWVRGAYLVPVAMASFDYAENAAVAYLLLTYPDISAVVVVSASAFTVAKSVLSTICFSALLGAALWLGARRIGKLIPPSA